MEESEIDTLKRIYILQYIRNEGVLRDTFKKEEDVLKQSLDYLFSKN